MKVFRFAFFLAVTAGLLIILENSFYGAPPLGRFLSPHSGFWQNAELEAIELPTSIDHPDIKEEVVIRFDDLLIPHIEASTLEDLYFAQGYVTAYHRLWQMDFYARVVMGRLSEVLGQQVLEVDRLHRRIGLTSMTQDVHQEIMNDPTSRLIVTSYTKGVNAYLDQLSPRNYPLEFKLLNYAPETWTTEKSSMVYALLSNTLSKGEMDLENTNVLMQFGKAVFDTLFDAQAGNLSPVISAGTDWDFEPLPTPPTVADYPIERTPNTLAKPDPLNGSNNFAVAGSRSRTGSPIVTNEMDLALTSPSIWYVTHLTGPDINVMGVTVAGTPGIIMGFNDSIAWGTTNSPRDQVDWYAIQFRDDTRKEYLYENKWFKTETRIERFQVAGQPDFFDTIIYVHHGPVVYDRNFMGDEENGKLDYAMRWIAHDRPTTFLAAHRINKARNHEDFVDAIRIWSGPPQNLIFGSASGDIALELPGKFPVKWPGQGVFLMDGSRADHEWDAIIPFAHRLRKVNPESGYLSSANQHPADSLYPYYIYDHNYEVYRNRRVNERLETMQNITSRDLMNLQNDNFNYIAYENLPFMLDSLDTLQLTTAQWESYEMLVEWDFFNEPDLTAPTLFEIWWDLLYAAVWDEFDTMQVANTKPSTYTTGHLMRTRPDYGFFDRLETPQAETSLDLINSTFAAMTDSISRMQSEMGPDLSWYTYKGTYVRHLLRLDPLSFHNIRIGGNHNIVNAAGENHGPSWRMVVELGGEGTMAYGVYPGSQSGNPGNSTYGHMIDQWANGDYYPLYFGRNTLPDEEVLHTLRIQPIDQ